MSCKEGVHEWRDAIEVLSTESHEFPGMEEKILSVLKFSYDGLETEKMKSCFLYCSLFPEDYQIEKEDLIEYWISEGFIKGERDEDGSNNKGHVIIGSTSEKEEEKQCVKTGVKLRRIPDDINWELPEEIRSLTSLQYLNLSRTGISSLLVGLKGLRKLISLDLEYCINLESIDGIGTSLPNLQVLKLFVSHVYIDARSIEELQLLEHLKILTGSVSDALILESIQRVVRLASCVQRLEIFQLSAEVLTLNTVALSGLRQLVIEGSEISEIKIDWKSKEKEDLPSACFKHLFSIDIFDLEGPKELTWLLFAPNLKHLEVIRSPSLEEIINKEKGMSISNVHPDMMVPFQKLQFLSLKELGKLKRICSSPPPALPSLRKFVVDDCPKLPKAAIREFQRHEQEISAKDSSTATDTANQSEHQKTAPQAKSAPPSPPKEKGNSHLHPSPRSSKDDTAAASSKVADSSVDCFTPVDKALEKVIFSQDSQAENPFSPAIGSLVVGPQVAKPYINVSSSKKRKGSHLSRRSSPETNGGNLSVNLFSGISLANPFLLLETHNLGHLSATGFPFNSKEPDGYSGQTTSTSALVPCLESSATPVILANYTVCGQFENHQESVDNAANSEEVAWKSPLEEIESLVSTRTTARLIPTTAKLDDDETRAPESTAWTEEAWSRLGGDGGARTSRKLGYSSRY
ncbi:BnaC06g03820D [Brassica napus]|uniref:BnaC06g03820D protein n=1 Tax=Brassica napus TaxID=3708 RepID=A0A078HGX5_BRANA|nr:BnaC06g03820D [Brassica napus]